MTAHELVQRVSEIYHNVTRHSDPKQVEEIKRVKYKVFYSALETFERPGGRVLMGMFPSAPGQYEYPAESVNRIPQEGWNAWADEKWEPARVVENLESVWRGWYGVTWHDELYRTFCSNLCPLRAATEALGVELYGSVLESFLPIWQAALADLKPRLLICHGNKEGLSPYGLFSRLYPATQEKQQSATAIGSLKVRWHVHAAPWGPLAVAGLPNLAKGKPALLVQNAELTAFIKRWDSPRKSEMRIVRKA